MTVDLQQRFQGSHGEADKGPEGISASALAREVGVSQPTLSRWCSEARILVPVSSPKNNSRDAEKSPQQWSAQEKLQLVVDAAQLSEEELGSFLRSRGVHMAQLEEWRRLSMEAAQQALESSKKPKKRKPSPEAKRIKMLEKEVLRKDRALAEVTALLALKKKVQELWGDEDDDTST